MAKSAQCKLLQLTDVQPFNLKGITLWAIMGPLQLSDHVVQNRQTGEQMVHWDMFNEATKFEFSLFKMAQCIICSPLWQFCSR